MTDTHTTLYGVKHVQIETKKMQGTGDTHIAITALSVDPSGNKSHAALHLILAEGCELSTIPLELEVKESPLTP